ncbi:MAG: alpha/beta hydrolase [Bdellovibrio sp.]|nr:MAG: alpha/beta hydrolase [Bdellovibrio sp.]
MKQEESFFSGFDGLSLYFQLWRNENVNAHLIITHGQGEHGGCYGNLAEALVDLPLQVWAWDWRGHGRSEGPRGAVRDFYEYTQDYEIFLKRVVKIDSLRLPVVLMGHSMGGLIQLKTLLGFPEYQRTPMILSAPFLGLAMKVPVWKKVVSRWAYEWAPQLTMFNEIQFNQLSSDPKAIEAYRKDYLRHRRISAGAFEPALKAAGDVLVRAPFFSGPILGFAADPDPLVSTPRIREFFDRLKGADQTLKLFSRRKHEILNDSGRQDAIRLIRSFLEEKVL